jgi:hypothetical protein
MMCPNCRDGEGCQQCDISPEEANEFAKQPDWGMIGAELIGGALIPEPRPSPMQLGEHVFCSALGVAVLMANLLEFLGVFRDTNHPDDHVIYVSWSPSTNTIYIKVGADGDYVLLEIHIWKGCGHNVVEFVRTSGCAGYFSIFYGWVRSCMEKNGFVLVPKITLDTGKYRPDMNEFTKEILKTAPVTPEDFEKKRSEIQNIGKTGCELYIELAVTNWKKNSASGVYSKFKVSQQRLDLVFQNIDPQFRGDHLLVLAIAKHLLAKDSGMFDALVV